jgi:hypothetical protein
MVIASLPIGAPPDGGAAIAWAGSAVIKMMSQSARQAVCQLETACARRWALPATRFAAIVRLLAVRLNSLAFVQFAAAVFMCANRQVTNDTDFDEFPVWSASFVKIRVIRD